MSLHTAHVSWKSASEESFASRKYSRVHTWRFDGGIEVPASASPLVVRAPFSSEAAIDPEEALVAAASSCHMMTFLWLCAKAGFVVESYEDKAEGEMSKNSAGDTWLSHITLRPQIVWAGAKRPSESEVKALHAQAHKECTIANSLKSEVTVAD